MNEISIHNRIADLVRQHGTLQAVSRVLKIDCGYLSRLSTGEKQAPGEKVLRKLGLVKRTTYHRKEQP